MISQREIARRLGVSVATVSRALHGDPSVRPETAERVREALAEVGYQLDPIVSAALARVRRRSFYRETLAWCGDAPRAEMTWLEPLFDSFDSFGARLGYRMEYFHFADTQPRTLERLAGIWRARGIQGVMLGPFKYLRETLAFPWEQFAWITFGAFLDQPRLHVVGRDHQADIETALAWLHTQGVRRPAFLLNIEAAYPFRRPMLDAAVRFHHAAGAAGPLPYLEINSKDPAPFTQWAERFQPDGLVLSWEIARPPSQFAQLPTVILTERANAGPVPRLHFSTRYAVLGQSSINLMHRLLLNQEKGVPAYKQRILISSEPRFLEPEKAPQARQA